MMSLSHNGAHWRVKILNRSRDIRGRGLVVIWCRIITVDWSLLKVVLSETRAVVDSEFMLLTLTMRAKPNFFLSELVNSAQSTPTPLTTNRFLSLTTSTLITPAPQFQYQFIKHCKLICKMIYLIIELKDSYH